MKKILLVTVLGVLLVGLIVPVLVQGQAGLNECCRIRHTFEGFPSADGYDTTFNKGCTIGAQNGVCTLTTEDLDTELASGGTCGVTGVRWFKDWGMVCLFNTIHTATNWLFMILMLVAVIMIVVGGFIYITASGDPEKAKSAKKYIVYALIGIAIALFARVFPSVIRFIMGV